MKKRAKSSKKSASKTTSKNKVDVTPLGDNVLVRPLSIEEMEGATTSFGIIIPDTAKEKPEQGVVVAVGMGKRTNDGKVMPLEVKVGDRIYFKKPWDAPMKIDGVEFYVINESEITLIRRK